MAEAPLDFVRLSMDHSEQFRSSLSNPSRRSHNYQVPATSCHTPHPSPAASINNGHQAESRNVMQQDTRRPRPVESQPFSVFGPPTTVPSPPNQLPTSSRVQRVLSYLDQALDVLASDLASISSSVEGRSSVRVSFSSDRRLETALQDALDEWNSSFSGSTETNPAPQIGSAASASADTTSGCRVPTFVLNDSTMRRAEVSILISTTDQEEEQEEEQKIDKQIESCQLLFKILKF